MKEKLLMETVALAGKIMLSSGSDSYRVEDTMKFMLQKSRCPITEVIVFATGIFLTLYDPEGETLTIAMRIPARSTNINRICRVNDLSRRFCRDEISLEETYQELKVIEKEVLYSRRRNLLGTIGVAACFCPVFGGGFWDILGGGLVGAALALADRYVKRIRLNDFFTNAFGAFVVAFTASLLANYVLPNSDENVMIMSTIMTLVPGVAFTTAIRDTLNGDYTTGASRMLEAIVIALAIAAGVGVGLVFWQIFDSGQMVFRGFGVMFPNLDLLRAVPWLQWNEAYGKALEVIGSGLAVFAFTMLLEIPKKHALNVSVLGGVNWMLYLIVMEETGSVMAASFVSSLVVAVLGQLLARVQKAPALLFLVAGILPTVPGAAIYRSVYYFIQNNHVACSRYLLQTLQIAGAIAMAIFVTDSLMRVVMEYQNSWNPKARS